MALAFSPKRLRKARLRKDWSQADLAYALKTSEKNIGRWERAQNVPRADAVAAIAAATGHAIEFFYTEADADEDDAEAALRRRARSFLDAMDDDMVRALHAEAAAKVVAREGAGA